MTFINFNATIYITQYTSILYTLYAKLCNTTGEMS